MARILVIDDEQRIGKFLRRTLEAGGHRVIEARTIDHGIALASAGAADLVILDPGRPGLDKQQAVSAIRRTCRIPIVLISASGAGTGETLDVGQASGIAELMARLRAGLEALDSAVSD